MSIEIGGAVEKESVKDFMEGGAVERCAVEGGVKNLNERVNVSCESICQI